MVLAGTPIPDDEESAAPTPPAAQPQAGGRELTDADILSRTEAIIKRNPTAFLEPGVTVYTITESELVEVIRHITGTKGAK